MILVVLMIISPIIIGIAYYQEIRFANEITRIISAVVLGLASDGAVSLSGFVTGKSLVAETASHTPRKKREVQTQVQESPKKYERKCKYCDEVLSSPQAVGGHMKKHHPEKCAKKVYELPVEMRSKP